MTEVARPGSQGSALGAILALCRVSNLPTVWMNVLAAMVLAGAGADPVLWGILALSLSAFYCGGMGLNDIFDRELDARDQPFRPIPAGRISLQRAQAVTTVLFALGLGLLLATPHPTALLPGLLLLATIFAYDRLHKAHPATVLLMAACRFGVFAVSGWAVAGTVSGLVALAGTIQLVYTLLVTVVARHENVRGTPYSWPVIPRMLAGMALVDGLVLSVLVSPFWLLPGIAAAWLTHRGQRWVRGD